MIKLQKIQVSDSQNNQTVSPSNSQTLKNNINIPLLNSSGNSTPFNNKSRGSATLSNILQKARDSKKKSLKLNIFQNPKIVNNSLANNNYMGMEYLTLSPTSHKNNWDIEQKKFIEEQKKIDNQILEREKDLDKISRQYKRELQCIQGGRDQIISQELQQSYADQTVQQFHQLKNKMEKNQKIFQQLNQQLIKKKEINQGKQKKVFSLHSSERRSSRMGYNYMNSSGGGNTNKHINTKLTYYQKNLDTNQKYMNDMQNIVTSADEFCYDLLNTSKELLDSQKTFHNFQNNMQQQNWMLSQEFHEQKTKAYNLIKQNIKKRREANSESREESRKEVTDYQKFLGFTNTDQVPKNRNPREIIETRFLYYLHKQRKQQNKDKKLNQINNLKKQINFVQQQEKQRQLEEMDYNQLRKSTLEQNKPLKQQQQQEQKENINNITNESQNNNDCNLNHSKDQSDNIISEQILEQSETSQSQLQTTENDIEQSQSQLDQYQKISDISVKIDKDKIAKLKKLKQKQKALEKQKITLQKSKSQLLQMTKTFKDYKIDSQKSKQQDFQGFFKDDIYEKQQEYYVTDTISKNHNNKINTTLNDSINTYSEDSTRLNSSSGRTHLPLQKLNNSNNISINNQTPSQPKRSSAFFYQNRNKAQSSDHYEKLKNPLSVQRHQRVKKMSTLLQNTQYKKAKEKIKESQQQKLQQKLQRQQQEQQQYLYQQQSYQKQSTNLSIQQQLDMEQNYNIQRILKYQQEIENLYQQIHNKQEQNRIDSDILFYLREIQAKFQTLNNKVADEILEITRNNRKQQTYTQKKLSINNEMNKKQKEYMEFQNSIENDQIMLRRFYNINRYLNKLYIKKKNKNLMSNFFELDQNWKSILNDLNTNNENIMELLNEMKQQLQETNQTPSYWSPAMKQWHQGIINTTSQWS